MAEFKEAILSARSCKQLALSLLHFTKNTNLYGHGHGRSQKPCTPGE